MTAGRRRRLHKHKHEMQRWLRRWLQLDSTDMYGGGGGKRGGGGGGVVGGGVGGGGGGYTTTNINDSEHYGSV